MKRKERKHRQSMTSLCLLLAQIARTGSCLLFMADARDVCSWLAFEPARAEAERAQARNWGTE